MNEIEARDAVFRQKFSQEQRRKKAPWSMMVPAELQQDELELWRALDAGDISEMEMLARMTKLMELYYSSSA